MTVRHEKINTQACIRGFYGIANGTDPKIRQEERDRIKAYWPDDLIAPIEIGYMKAPPWRMLLDPTGWHDVPPEDVANYVRTYLTTNKKWPSLDGLRKAFGRVSNHRGPDEIPEQKALFG